MRVIFDDVFFCFADSGISRYWRSLLENLASHSKNTIPELELIILNRSNKLVDLGFQYVDFPRRSWGSKYIAQDREIVSKVCESLNADIYISSYYGFSLSCKNLLPVYDLIPEFLGFEELNRDWIERKLSILSCENYLTISKSTRHDLISRYMVPDENKVNKVLPGIDSKIFYVRDESEINAFKQKYKLGRRYVVVPGSRYGTQGYKNGQLLLKAIQSGWNKELSVVFTGGESITPEELHIFNHFGVELKRMFLDDDELAICYSGSEVVVYPSFYEGFGLPPLEALACGVPVITTLSSSLPEAVGDLSLATGGEDGEELLDLIEKSGTDDWRRYISEEGPKWSSNFDWNISSLAFIAALKNTYSSDYGSRINSKLIEYNEIMRIQQR